MTFEPPRIRFYTIGMAEEKLDVRDSFQDVHLEEEEVQGKDSEGHVVEGLERPVGANGGGDTLETAVEDPPDDDHIQSDDDAPIASIDTVVEKKANDPNAFGKEFEEAAAVAAAVTREAAAAAQEKLVRASNEVKGFFGSLWGSLDDSPGVWKSRQGMSSAATSQDMKERFGIDDEDEKILESFRCKMIQQYVASNNSFTPPKTIGFSGQLHIASNHVIFEFDNRSNGKPVVIPVADVNTVQQNDEEQLEGVLVMNLKGSRTLVCGQFSFPKLEIESALLLLGRKITVNQKK